MKDVKINDIKSLAHTQWNCKYHIVFAPKYRRKVFYESKRLEIGQIIRQLCEWKGITIIEAEVCPDHIHMLVEIPPKYSISSVMGFLKGKSSLMIYSRWANMRYQYRNREWDVKRLLTKNNYLIHTDAIKNYILLDNNYYKNKERLKYAEEADILNVVLFNTTAKEWRDFKSFFGK